jgi:apolipoprotein N-acyltransferase
MGRRMTTVEETAESSDQQPDVVSPALAPKPVRTWPGVLLALAAGGGLNLSLPPYGLWWVAPMAVAMLGGAVHRRRGRRAAGLGAMAGLVFFLPLLTWTDIVGGAAPWLLLAALESSYIALLAAALAWCSPLFDRYRWTWPVVTGALWVGDEAIRSRIPFGGFPWGRLGFSQTGSPLLRFAAIGGAPLVGFAVAVAGGLLLVAFWANPARPGRLARMVPLAGAGVVVLLGFAVPTFKPDGPTVTVAIIQGNVPRLGLEFNAQRRAVLDDHVNATIDLANQVRAGKAKQPDLVIWPENASDIDPLTAEDADARERIDEAATQIDAPILVGAILQGPGDNARNAGLVWSPTTGPGQTYIKQHPVPFAEYMPLRSIARLVSRKVDLITEDFLAGTKPGVLQVGPATVGDVICFEVAYDNIVRDTVLGGGQLIAVQTNNADFNVPEAEQQLAMVQLRAVEFGREALMSSTVGISAFVTSDGQAHDASAFNTKAILVRDVQLGTGRTPAAIVGPLPEYMIGGLGVLALAWAGLVRRRASRPMQEDL